MTSCAWEQKYVRGLRVMSYCFTHLSTRSCKFNTKCNSLELRVIIVLKIIFVFLVVQITRQSPNLPVLVTRIPKDYTLRKA